MKEFLNCDLLLAYYPIKSEASVLPLVKLAFEIGKPVAMPISIKESYSLDFRIISSLDEMKLGAYSIPEPDTCSPRAILSERTLCIVPALAFDIKGNRLGYGKGFYDRFLSEFKGCSIGITFSELLSDSLPIDENDIAIHTVVTDKIVQKV